MGLTTWARSHLGYYSLDGLGELLPPCVGFLDCKMGIFTLRQGEASRGCQELAQAWPTGGAVSCGVQWPSRAGVKKGRNSFFFF